MQPKRIIISLLVVILAMLSVGAVTVSAEDSTTLDIAVEVTSSTALSDKVCSVEVGDIVTVSVTINSNPGLVMGVFKLEYNPDYLYVSKKSDDSLALESGPLFAGATRTAETSGNAVIYTVEQVKPETGTGVVFTCNFKVKAHGTSRLVLDTDEKDVITLKDNKWVSVDKVNVSYTEGKDATGAGVYAHDFGTPTKMPPTCTDNGKDVYICTTCNQKITVDNGTPATGHTEVGIPSVKVTCSQDGMTEGRKCSVCNTVTLAPILVVEKSPEYHVVVTDPAVAPTCTATGLTEGSHCSECDLVYVAQETIEKTEHKYSDWTVVTEATEEADGLRTKTCEVCGDTVKEAIPYDNGGNVLKVVLIVVGAVALLGGGGFCLYWFVFKKKKQVV